MVDLGGALDRNIDDISLDVHQVSLELELREDGGQFVMGHLHVFLMVLHLILVIDVWVKLLEGAAIAMIDEDNLSA